MNILPKKRWANSWLISAGSPGTPGLPLQLVLTSAESEYKVVIAKLHTGSSTYLIDAVGSSQIFFPTQNLARAY